VFQLRDGRPELFRLPELNFIDDKAGKPVGIEAALTPAIVPGNRMRRGTACCCSNERSSTKPKIEMYSQEFIAIGSIFRDDS
jgi:hypothetical protein